MFSFQLGLFCTKWSMKLLMAFACVSRIASSKIYIIFKNQQIVISFSDFHWNKSLYGVYFLAFQNFSASVYLIFHIKLSNVYKTLRKMNKYIHPVKLIDNVWNIAFLYETSPWERILVSLKCRKRDWVVPLYYLAQKEGFTNYDVSVTFDHCWMVR